MSEARSDITQQPPSRARGRGRPPLSQADIAGRRARIIDAASRMFFSEGFAETTLDAIGREAGVTRRTIYELVGDKTALFHAACDQLRVLGPRFRFDIPVAGRSPRDVLCHMARILFDHAVDKELIAIERAVILESTRSPDVVGEMMISAKQGLIDAVAKVFERLVAETKLGAIDTQRAADIFYDISVGGRGLRAVLGHPDDPLSDGDLEQRVDMFLNGYLLRSVAESSRPS